MLTLSSIAGVRELTSSPCPLPHRSPLLQRLSVSARARNTLPAYLTAGPLGLHTCRAYVSAVVIAAPASEAYAERVFSVCGDLTARKRNRTGATLEQRVFLKMNSKFVGNSSFRFK
jgi:hypothetical protein